MNVSASGEGNKLPKLNGRSVSPNKERLEKIKEEASAPKETKKTPNNPNNGINTSA